MKLRAVIPKTMTPSLPLKRLFALSFLMLAWSVYGQNGSRTWTGAVDNDYFNGGNWTESGGTSNFPNGNVTFSGSSNTNIARTSNSYTYIYGIFLSNSLSTDEAFTIGADNTETQINLGGPNVKTTALTDGGTLTDVIKVNMQIAGGTDAQRAKKFEINTGHNLSLEGILSTSGAGPFTLEKLGDGTLSLGDTNTYSGATTVSAGILELTNIDALGSDATGSETTVSSGATLKLAYTSNNVASTENLTLNGSGVSGSGALHAVNSDHGGEITLGSDATINVETRMDHQGAKVINGTGTLTKIGSGTLVRAGNMTVDNFVVAAGEYLMTRDAALIKGDGSNAKSNTIQNGAKISMWKGFNITNTPDIVMEAGSIIAVTSNTADQTTSMNGKFTLNGDARFENWSHDHTVLADIVGTGGLTLISTVSNQDIAKYTFSGNNTYSGDTTVGNGNNGAGKMTLIAGSTTGLSENSALQVTANSTVQLNSYSSEVAALSGAGTVENANATGATLTVGGNNSSFTFSGTLKDGTGSGALSLTKTGSGTMTLSGANTYTGATTISAGTLRINGNHGSASGAVTVANGGTLGGSGSIGSATTVQSGGTLAPGNSPGVLTFQDDLTLDAGSATVMEIAGTTRGTGYDGIDIGGVFTMNGSLSISADTHIAGGTYDLFGINGSSS